jgi:hypothetical protein
MIKKLIYYTLIIIVISACAYTIYPKYSYKVMAQSVIMRFNKITGQASIYNKGQWRSLADTNKPFKLNLDLLPDKPERVE